MLGAPFAMAREAPPDRPIWAAWIITGPIGILLLYGAIYCALELSRGFVRASDGGLSWRKILKTRSVTWDEVTDFYDLPPRGARNFAIETCAGTLKLDGQWTNTGALRDFIQVHAVQSKSRTWMLQPKNEKWPRVFHYRDWENRYFKPLMAAFGVFAWPCLLVPGLFQPQNLRSDFIVFGSLPGILFIVGKLCVVLAMPFFCARFFLPEIREVRRRQNERITATPDSLIFDNGDQHIEMRWNEITDFFIVPSTRLSASRLYVVETKQGKIEFNEEIRPYRGLHILIQERATNSASREWQVPGAKDIETIGGESSKWRDGQRVHAYRTRSNRALLWFPTFLCILLPIVTWLKIQGFNSTDDPPHPKGDTSIFISVALIILVSVAVCGWWGYYKFSIRTDEHGLTQTGWRGEKFIAWQDITDFYRSGDSFYITTINGARVRFGNNIAAWNELHDTIVRHTEHKSAEH